MEWPEIYARLRADRNDASAWTELEARVRRWARSTLGSHGPDLVEDAVADTCSRVVLDLADARGAETFGGFAKGKFLNARKTAIAWLREPKVPLDIDHELAAPITERSAESSHDGLYAAIDRCMERLPTRDRLAVTLRYYDDAHSARIALALGVSEGNARRIVFNGLTRLRKCAQAALAPPHGTGSLARA